jgi:hypothetical protein
MWLTGPCHPLHRQRHQLLKHRLPFGSLAENDKNGQQILPHANKPVYQPQLELRVLSFNNLTSYPLEGPFKQTNYGSFSA